jgi:hypothetical protein
VGVDVVEALALDPLDPAELIDHGVGEPSLPQAADDLGRWFAKCHTAFRGQLQPRAVPFGQTAGLDQ